MKRVLAVVLCMITLLTWMPVSAGMAEVYEEITPGTRGDVVEKLQRRLAELGFYEDSLNAPYSYGNMTKAAVAAFQKANGLKDDGIATAATLALLYSDAAKAAPPKPDVQVTSVKRSNYRVSIAMKNNTNETINYVELRLMTYNLDGSVHSIAGAGNVDNLGSEWFGYSIIVNKTIAPGKIVTFTDYYDINSPVLAVGANAYHTTSGKKTLLSSDQITFFTSEGKTIEAPDQSKKYQTISQADYDKARTIVWGYNYREIPHYLSKFYMRPSGLFLSTVNPGSIAEKAGLQSGDVITSLDGQKAINVYAAEYAKLKMLDGQAIEVEYWRNNKMYTTIFSLNDADYVTAAPAEEETATISIADELLKYADLLKNGLITQEEYDTLKQKLLN